MRTFARIEKAIADGLVLIAALLLAGIVALFGLEILMRYALNSPTRWSLDLVGFLLPVMIFLVLPEVTRRNQHIVISVVTDHLPPTGNVFWSRVVAAISAVVSLTMFWIVSSVTYKQFDSGLLTNTVVQIPKWWLMASVSLSFLLVGTIYLATSLGLKREHDRG